MPPKTHRDASAFVADRPYLDLDRLSNADGLVAIISERLSSGQLTFCIVKEFERRGKVESSGFVSENLAQSFLDFAKIVTDRVAAIRSDPDLLRRLEMDAGITGPVVTGNIAPASAPR